MSYATLDDLKKRFGNALLVRLTDRAEVPTGVIDEGVVEEALADTDAVIDGYLEAKYALPVSEVPTQLKDLGKAIAIYKLHVEMVGEKITKDYENALRMLREIAHGDIRLTIAGKVAANNGASGVRTTDRKRPFTNENLKGFIG